MALFRQSRVIRKIAENRNSRHENNGSVMIPLLLGIIFLVILFAPGWWAKRTLAQYSREVPDLPGTGGDLAASLLERAGINNVKVELADKFDHYDPVSKVVALTPAIFAGKSLAAVAVAAHEVGHAIQDHESYPPFQARIKLIYAAQTMEKAGSMALLAAPLLIAITRSPRAGLFMALITVAGVAMSAALHLMTLPVEWDASFGRAMPLLMQGGYIAKEEAPAVKKTLQACALTYVAASLAGILNLWRWLYLLVRR